MNDIFSRPVFDPTVTYGDHEFFKGQGAAKGWADKVGKELGVPVEVRKVGNGWALCATIDGVPCTWGIHGQRLKRAEGLPT